MHKRCFKLSLVSALIGLIFFNVMPALGHRSGGYYRADSPIDYSNEDWMADLPDSRRLSELSIPGTHDTMSLHGNWYTKCQSMSLSEQLKAGIRAFDIRLAPWRECATCEEYKLRLWHGFIDQKAFFDSDVLEVCIQFLRDHPTETILMRIKRELVKGNPPVEVWYGRRQDFEVNLKNHINTYIAAFEKYVYDYVYGWNSSISKFEGDSNPILDDKLRPVRGKIVILDNVSGEGLFGINYSQDSLCIQDYWDLVTNWDLYKKWRFVKEHLENAYSMEKPDSIYVNFLSGSSDSGGVFTHFVASGHSDPRTNAPRLATGMLWDNVSGGSVCWWTSDCWPDFPRKNCCCWPWWIKTCTVFFEGTNELTYKYILAFPNTQVNRWGIIMADFPGEGLIDAIISANFPSGWAALVSANGPYEGDEGSEITFEASPSDDGFQYKWSWHRCDTDDEGVCIPDTEWEYETDWSNYPTASYTWSDDWFGTATVEITDATVTHNAETQVIINNVAPSVAIDSIISPVKGCILPGQEVGFIGSFTDPGYLDTHTAQWNFGDGSTESGTLTEENEKPDATGSVLYGHTYGEPGIFTVLLEILDDDGGIGTANVEVKVMTASEAVDFADSFIQDLPESCFKGQADNRKNAFSNKFKAVKNALGGGGIRGVINKLINDIRAKADGSVDGKSSNDWITDGEVQEELCLVIDELVKHLASL